MDANRGGWGGRCLMLNSFEYRIVSTRSPPGQFLAFKGRILEFRYQKSYTTKMVISSRFKWCSCRGTNPAVMPYHCYDNRVPASWSKAEPVLNRRRRSSWCQWQPAIALASSSWAACLSWCPHCWPEHPQSATWTLPHQRACAKTCMHCVDLTVVWRTHNFHHFSCAERHAMWCTRSSTFESPPSWIDRPWLLWHPLQIA